MKRTTTLHQAQDIDIIDNGSHFSSTDVEGALQELAAGVPAPVQINGLLVQDEGVLLGTGTILNFVGNNVVATISGTVVNIFVTGSASVGTNPPITGSIIIWDEGVNKGSSTILNFVGDNVVATISGTVANIYITGSSSGGQPTGVFSSDETLYYNDACALLDPDCLLYFKKGTFTYSISTGSIDYRYILASFNTQINSSGRFEVRNPREPMLLRGVTLGGIGDASPSAGATAIALNPFAVAYANSRNTYYQRLRRIREEFKMKKLDISASTYTPFLPGAYGAIIKRVNFYDLYWVVGRYLNGYGFNLNDEISDSASIRNDNNLSLVVDKRVICEVEGGGGTGGGSVVYVLLPSDWSTVTDPLAPYDFREDFSGNALEATGTWSRTQSSVGNIEINTDYAWCKIVGSSSWGANGMRTNLYSFTRASAKKMVIDVYTGQSAAQANFMFGVGTGAGVNYSDVAHGLNMNGGNLEIYENGTKRATTTTVSPRTIYRFRFSPQGGGSCVFEMQGGTHPDIGGSSWDNISSGTSSSATNTFYPTITSWSNTGYISDIRVHS